MDDVGHADAQVSARERTAGIEREPAERQDERAENDQRDVVSRQRIGTAVLVVLAEARAEQPCEDQRNYAALQVHEAVKALLGLGTPLRNRLFTIDAFDCYADVQSLA